MTEPAAVKLEGGGLEKQFPLGMTPGGSFSPDKQIYNIMEGLHVSQVSPPVLRGPVRNPYRRSTNNSHKKFISIARKLLVRSYPLPLRQRFDHVHREHKNSRAFFFIVLAHVKKRMNPQQQHEFVKAFNEFLEVKVNSYRRQINSNDNRQFVNFRMDEIFDIQYAQTAAQLYFQGQTEAAIETLYRKDKVSVVKKQQYENALKAVTQIQKKLDEYPPGEIVPYLKYEGEASRVNSMGIQFERELMRDRQREEEAGGQRRGDKRRPLAELAHSYPVYPHFYPVMFNTPPYQPEPLNTHPLPAQSYQMHPDSEYPFMGLQPGLSASLPFQPIEKPLQPVKEEAVEVFPGEVAN